MRDDIDSAPPERFGVSGEACFLPSFLIARPPSPAGGGAGFPSAEEKSRSLWFRETGSPVPACARGEETVHTAAEAAKSFGLEVASRPPVCPRRGSERPPDPAALPGPDGFPHIRAVCGRRKRVPHRQDRGIAASGGFVRAKGPGPFSRGPSAGKGGKKRNCQKERENYQETKTIMWRKSSGDENHHVGKILRRQEPSGGVGNHPDVFGLSGRAASGFPLPGVIRPGEPREAAPCPERCRPCGIQSELVRRG